MAKKSKYYVVWNGVTPGIYDSWKLCEAQVKNFPGAAYKSFDSKEEAELAYHSGKSGSFASFSQKSKPTSKSVSKQVNHNDIIWDSISVDAACSGNPGVMEYQGVETKNGNLLFHQKFDLGTNNIGEFLAIVHGLAMLKKEKKALPIYTDSKIAIKWVNQKHCATKLEKKSKTAYLFELIERAENWLKNNSYENKILKWETEYWGEIPADFGRK